MFILSPSHLGVWVFCSHQEGTSLTTLLAYKLCILILQFVHPSKPNQKKKKSSLLSQVPMSTPFCLPFYPTTLFTLYTHFHRLRLTNTTKEPMQRYFDTPSCFFCTFTGADSGVLLYLFLHGERDRHTLGLGQNDHVFFFFFFWLCWLDFRALVPIHNFFLPFFHRGPCDCPRNHVLVGDIIPNDFCLDDGGFFFFFGELGNLFVLGTC
ncbi:hypothetical protein QBC45DRAFT_216690 [Copromyces sp. CBS 386.78]|nr:hypothetical protein QBC45DRAFT_216690 [Copromyces sp. CBS 386.78]